MLALARSKIAPGEGAKPDGACDRAGPCIRPGDETCPSFPAAAAAGNRSPHSRRGNAALRAHSHQRRAGPLPARLRRAARRRSERLEPHAHHHLHPRRNHAPDPRRICPAGRPRNRPLLSWPHGQHPANELAADRMGAELACRAGFDPAAGASLFRHLRPSRVHPKAGVRRAAVLAAGCGDASGPPDQPAKAPIAAIISGRASRLGSDPSQLAAAARMASNQGSNRPGSISWKSTGFSTPTGSQ